MSSARDLSRFAVLPVVHSMDRMMLPPFYGRSRHPSGKTELLHVVKGRVELVIGRWRYAAGPGDTLLVPPRTYHRDSFDSKRGLEVFMVFFDWAPEKEFFRLVSNRILERMPPHRKAEVSKTMERLIAEHPTDPAADQLVIASRVHTVLLLLAREALLMRRGGERESAAGGRQRRRELMQQAKQYLEAHYAEPVSLDDVATALHVSPFYLSHVFSEESAFTLFHYLTTLRMEKAKELLAQGRIKVSAAARTVGYENSNYFSRAFRKYFGIAPQAMRRRKPQQSA